MTKINKLFMAFGVGRESTQPTTVSRYIGIAPVSILAVNPTKEELEKVYNRTLEASPEYLGSVEKDGTKINTVRIDFIVATTPEESNGIDMKTKVSFFLRNSFMFNNDKTKVKVIDKYGRTAWVPVEEAKEYKIPMYKNGPARLDPDYRPLYIGEEALTNFVKKYMGIEEVDIYKDGKWVMKENAEQLICRLDNIPKYFTGNVSEIKDAVFSYPNNKVKMLFGVRTNDRGQYQTVFTDEVLYYGSKRYDKLQKTLDERLANNGYSDSEFLLCDLKEYVQVSSDLSTPQQSSMKDDLPFGPGEMNSPWG